MEKVIKGYLTPAAAGKVAAALRTGGTAVLPTDTIYGLHCLASNSKAVKRIMDLKGRGGKMGMILLASDLAMVDRLVSKWPGESRPALSRIWPARLTAILPASPAVGAALAPGGRVAVRIPASPGLIRLIRRIGEPLVSTSVNRSGSPPMTRIKEIMNRFPGLDAYISQRGRPSARPSTIVDTSGGTLEVVREGSCRIALQASALSR